MELFFEILIDLIIDGTIDISSNKKVPKYIRYPLIFLVVIIFSMIMIGSIVLAIICLNEGKILSGIFTIIVIIALFVFSIIKFKRIYYNKKIRL